MTATIDTAVLAEWIGWAHAIALGPDHVVQLPLLLSYGEGAPRLWARPVLSVVRGHGHAFSAEPDLAAMILGEVEVEPELIDDAEFEAALLAALAALSLDFRPKAC